LKPFDSPDDGSARATSLMTVSGNGRSGATDLRRRHRTPAGRETSGRAERDQRQPAGLDATTLTPLTYAATPLQRPTSASRDRSVQARLPAGRERAQLAGLCHERRRRLRTVVHHRKTRSHSHR
jgi:hypothetical protein